MTGKRETTTRGTEHNDQKDRSGNPGEDQSKPQKKHYRQTIFKDWCKKCGICSSFCPKNVIGQDEDGGPIFERPEDCIGCRFCELHCPDFAITVTEIPSEQKEDE